MFTHILCPTDLKERAQVAIESREQMRAAIRQLHAEDIQVGYKLREGKPARKIVKVAEKLGVELIVMTTDGRDNIKDFVTGTITEHVINQAPCPVLVIPYKLKP